MLVPAGTVPLDLLTAAKASGGPLASVKAELFTNNHPPSVLDDLSSYSIATFDGYAASATVVWGTPYYDQEGQARMDTPLLQFNMTGPTTPQVCYGYLLRSTATVPALVCAELFPAPINLARVGDAAAFVASFEAPAGGSCTPVE